MDSVKSNEMDSASFIIHTEPGFTPNNVPIKYSSIKNNKTDYRIVNITNSNVYLDDDSLWSNYNPNYNNSDEESEKLIMKTNNENDFSNMWIYYKKIIHLD